MKQFIIVYVFVSFLFLSGCKAIQSPDLPKNDNKAIPFLHKIKPDVIKKHPDWFGFGTPLPIQVRIFDEYPLTTTGKDFVKAVQLYGMAVEPDGSEKVVWKKCLHRWKLSEEKGDKRFKSVKVLYADKNTVYLHFDYHGDGDKALYKIERQTGRILILARESDSEYKTILENVKPQIYWYDYPIIKRPIGTNSGGQTYSETIIKQKDSPDNSK